MRFAAGAGIFGRGAGAFGRETSAAAARCVRAARLAARIAARTRAAARFGLSAGDSALDFARFANAPLRPRRRCGENTEISRNPVRRGRTRRANSLVGAGWRGQNARFRENLIGRSLCSLRLDYISGQRVGSMLRRALALLDQQTRQHGGRAFLQPLIEKRRNLFPQIRGTRQAREFVALQRRLRRREQELPAGLGRVMGQGEPPSDNKGVHSNHSVITVKDKCTRTVQRGLWKSVENAVAGPLHYNRPYNNLHEITKLLIQVLSAGPEWAAAQRDGIRVAKACSHCSGDYEDPERSAPGRDEDEQDQEGKAAPQGG